MKRGGPLPRTTALKAKAPMRTVSRKRRKHRASAEGRAGMDHMGRVKMLACVICQAPPPNDAHHCRSLPPDGERHAYVRLPAAGRKSDDRDTIPLCRSCHTDGPEAYHRDKAAWEAKNGPDYGFIPLVRALLDTNETIDF